MSLGYRQFQHKILQHHRKYGRKFPWRETKDPYKILISEVMLQQTQTKRVLQKYDAFIQHFPTAQTLATASLKDVLTVWQGLGYNRRALYLHKTAQYIVKNFNGLVPSSPQRLVQLPGIGKTTAAAVGAFAFNQPTVFIETNIRTVFIHFFFREKKAVQDHEILPYLEKTLYVKNPRIWYYALMDYGVMLKKEHTNPSRLSAHHHRQSPFKNSDRQIRGKILKLLLIKPRAWSDLRGLLKVEESRLKRVVRTLQEDELVVQERNKFIIHQ